MSKVATYLRGHVSGEVSIRDDVRLALSIDTGVLQIMPEMVVYPRNTNDIRKVARFAWQLAEKGHVLPLTVRGAGSDSTGAAIGKGAVMVTPAHMNNIFEYDVKQKLVRLQPGVTVAALQSALALHGASIAALVGSQPFGTVGGAVASAVVGPFAGKYGAIEPAVEQLEVVLANGDILQTGRLSKRDFSKKKGLQGLEGDIYRGIDAIIEEYSDVLNQLAPNDNTGYNTIADVRRKDGSFDLTPLFVGSQGTLGFISEMIMRAEFRSTHMGLAVFVFASADAARDALDELARLKPAMLEYLDAQLFETASEAGRTFSIYATATEKFKPTSIVVAGFDDFNERTRLKMLKKATKKYEKTEGVIVTTDIGEDSSDLMQVLNVAYYTIMPDRTELGAPSLFSGFHIPMARLEDFSRALAELALQEHLNLPLAGHVTTGVYAIYPIFAISKVGDKQKVFKLLDALTKLVYLYGGTMVAEGGEGRLKARAIYSGLDEKIVQMYEAVRKVCDPLGILNPGVKQAADIRTLVAELRDSQDNGQLARFGV